MILSAALRSVAGVAGVVVLSVVVLSVAVLSVASLSGASLFAPLLSVEFKSLDTCEKIKAHTQSIKPAQQINRFIITDWYFYISPLKATGKTSNKVKIDHRV
jgi:hypothetical protein